MFPVMTDMLQIEYPLLKLNNIPAIYYNLHEIIINHIYEYSRNMHGAFKWSDSRHIEGLHILFVGRRHFISLFLLLLFCFVGCFLLFFLFNQIIHLISSSPQNFALIHIL